MTNYLNRAMDMILGTMIRTEIPSNPRGGGLRAANINLIVMSHQTAREIMRHDYGRVFHKSMHRDQPDRLGPARVAYDDSMRLGEFIVAEAMRDKNEVGDVRF